MAPQTTLEFTVLTDCIPQSDLDSSFTFGVVTMNIITQGVLIYKGRIKGAPARETMQQRDFLEGLIDNELKKVEAKKRVETCKKITARYEQVL